MSFKIIKKSAKSKARLGRLTTARGSIKTPFFMPIATRGSVKALSFLDLEKLDSQIILSNTYHLYLKPGLAVLKKAGGLHKYMKWSGPILTDSGGFQVFSLGAKSREQRTESKEQGSLVKITDKGVEFRSVYDGSKHLFTPKKVLEIQSVIGSDIRMVLDVCSPAKCSREQAEKDLTLTIKWAQESARIKSSLATTAKRKTLSSADDFLLFGIVQGALYKDLRLKSAKELSSLNFDGYAVGGLAVGETPAEMNKVLDYTVPALPADKPHYLMGVGYPEQIVQAVKRGIDMFDCVIPTREARHGRLYLWRRFTINDSRFYDTINVKSAKFAKDNKVINPDSQFPELRAYTRSYLRHLFLVGEPLALRLATLNNLEFYLGLMKNIRNEIKNNNL